MPRVVMNRDDVIALLAEVFRQYGYSGASLSAITQHTGLGKGSLYHYFPSGKKEMAEAVLDNVAHWFDTNVFAALRDNSDAEAGIAAMFEAVDHYFNSGQRICLVGAFALDDTRDRFASRINTYFSEWVRSLALALNRTGLSDKKARKSAEDVVAGIQGALVLARSQDNPKLFARSLKRLQKRLALGSRA